MLLILLPGHVPFVVNVIVQALIALALTSICPVEVFKNIKPDGLEVNVPVAPPGIVANISLPVWHNVEGEQLNEELSVGFTVMV